VLVNNHVAEFEEPPFIEERTFACPEGPLTLGADAVTLTVRVSPTPLEETTNGIDILSRGVYHETTLAGRDKAEMHEYCSALWTCLGSKMTPGQLLRSTTHEAGGSIPPTRSSQRRTRGSEHASKWFGLTLSSARENGGVQPKRSG